MEKFIILADKRTGSSMLADTIDSHPDIKVYDELYMVKASDKSGKRRGQFLYKHMLKTKKMTHNQYLDFIYTSIEKEAIGFRYMYPHDEKWTILPLMLKEKIKIIHLIRENLFKQVMSKITRTVFDEGPKMYNPESILAEIRKHEGKQKAFKEKLKGYKHVLDLSYENIIGRTEGELCTILKYGAFNLKSDQLTYLKPEVSKSICDFLGVNNQELFTNVTKKNRKDV
jgi:hypothetical protein